MKGINVKKSFGLAASVTAGLLFSGMAAAQTFAPSGPVQITGQVSVDNTAKSGGSFSDFACAVEMFGFAPTGSNVISITGVQVLNDADGQIERGCHTVQPFQLLWTVTVVGTTATIDDIAFQAVGTGQPGCGFSGGSPDPASQLVTTWDQDNSTLPAGAQFDPAFSRIVMAADPISDGDTGNCTISGEIRITRPSAPRI